jgi:methylenetetrahydrofolate dehydrogenase (NADP+)/methenyltetrahydrofolate cyclohydrolase
MQIIDGNALSKAIKEEIAVEIQQMLVQGVKQPHLAAVLVGDNPASESYVRNKIRSCEQVGMKSTLIRREATITQKDLLKIVDDLNNDKDIDGFIVQLPLPKHLDETEITLAIDYRKDVDGFHPVNFGRMAQGLPAFLPATPMGILTMLERFQIPTAGKHCVILGRSNIVGTPAGILMSRKAYPGNCTVTIAHSRTQDIAAVTASADILIAAIGSACFVKADMVKEGAVVIDVGMNRVDDPTAKNGYRLKGDVDFDSVAPKCSFITPVPGGVGPMTVVSLIQNTLKAAKQLIYQY